jgi:hypothetical protein
VIHRPFTVRPVEDIGFFTGCITERVRVKTTEHVIENIPFQYAWPVLSGWDLTFDCEDQHVTEIGVWLHDISYAAGVLRYKVSAILRDKDSEPGFGARYGVSVLGLNRSGGALRATKVSSCRRDAVRAPMQRVPSTCGGAKITVLRSPRARA